MVRFRRRKQTETRNVWRSTAISRDDVPLALALATAATLVASDATMVVPVAEMVADTDPDEMRRAALTLACWLVGALHGHGMTTEQFAAAVNRHYGIA